MTEQHPLQLYNSLTRTKEPFIPQDPKRVTMYNCGPTVYSYAHIGNARAAVVADVLFRVLRHIYGEDHVVYARNLTDVDDRIIQSPKETGRPISFVLWKPELDGVGWDAPFGKGRPGWHIECSAMAKATLCDEAYGNTIDIHCGGVDLKFPHHENEKAQSCCANGTDKFAKFWVHNEFLNMGSEKMSKSLGNVTLVNDLLKEWDGEVIRLALLKAHYRSELSWSEDLLKESKAQLDRWYRQLEQFPDCSFEKINTDLQNFILEIGSTYFEEKIYSDLNSAEALKALSMQKTDLIHGKTAKDFHGNLQPLKIQIAGLKYCANIIGLLQKDPEAWFKGGASSDEETLFNAIAKKRQDARAIKDWPAADAARDEATANGIVLEDGPNGTTWRKA